MEKAKHPSKEALITVKEYIIEFGNKPLGLKDIRPKCHCPICNQVVFEKNVNTVSSPNGNFSHYPKSGFCPIKSNSSNLYHLYFPSSPDKKHGLELKNLFRKNWQKHYRQISFLAKNLQPIEFIELIILANQQKIWEYAKLEEYQIPYILLTLADFPNQKGTYKNKRYCWFRFWFDASIQRYEEIWNNSSLPVLWRAYYYLSGKQRKPSEINLKNMNYFIMDKTFLEQEISLPQFIIQNIEQWFETHNFV